MFFLILVWRLIHWKFHVTCRISWKLNIHCIISLCTAFVVWMHALVQKMMFCKIRKQTAFYVHLDSYISIPVYSLLTHSVQLIQTAHVILNCSDIGWMEFSPLLLTERQLSRRSAWRHWRKSSWEMLYHSTGNVIQYLYGCTRPLFLDSV